MSNVPPSKMHLTPSDSIRYTLPAPYHPVLTVEDCNAIFQLFNGTTRAPHLCISKGQLRHLCEQLGARNHMLVKRVQEQDAFIRALTKHCEELEAQMQDDAK